MSKPIICCDFDGTIHSYEHGWRDESIYGTVTRGFFDWLVAVTSADYEVAVYSTRSAQPQGIHDMCTWLERQYDDWREEDNAHPSELPPITWPIVKPRAIVSIDDRALTFRGDWTAFYPTDIKAFHVWNKPDQETAAMAVISETDPSHVMNTITDDSGRKQAERLFKTYVRDQAHVARLPAFLIAVDRLLSGLGGVPVDPEAEAREKEENTDDEDGTGADTDEDYDDDEDIHDPQSSAGTGTTPGQGDTETAAEKDAEGERVRRAVYGMLSNNR